MSIHEILTGVCLTPEERKQGLIPMILLPQVLIQSEAVELLGKDLSSQRSSSRLNIIYPRTLATGIEKLAQLGGESLNHYYRAFVGIKLMVDVLRLKALKTNQAIKFSVGTRSLDPDFLFSDSPELDKTRKYLILPKWEIELIQNMARRQNMSMQQYARGALAFCLQAIALAQEQSLPIQIGPLGTLPISINGHSFLFAY